ncbi:D-alanyl-D-alanine carboxypeptidase [Streptomyces chartreusis]|uniref:D-alanyl-D-alanine carboxypeptidase n=1 Tax=Streptomyces chartreusis TaxID=1969 RepID=UPI00198D6ADC|nr:D-alanyl-D-alanine carboxypeptidase [Streptomyces chartreusis]GGX17359.1 D-alanyl-D-alanine carboxypeptidase [Streptomyces chartreusis]
MAGESPDRSKQRESSAEPTSGSAIPVPESRPEPEGGAEKRDPRLAVARESASARKPASRGGVDTATRVLSRRELEAVRAELESEGAEKSDGAEDSEDPTADDATAKGGDAADPESAKTGTPDTGDADADDEQADAEGEDAEDAKADASGDEGADAEAERADAAEPEDAVPAEAGGDAGSGSGDDRLKAAVAAWVATSDGDAKDATADAGDTAEGADSDVETDAAAASDADDAATTAEDGPAEAAEASEAPEAAEAPEGADKDAPAASGGSPEDAAPADPRKTAAASTAAEAPEDAVPGKDAEAGSKADAGKDQDAKGDAPAGSDRREGDGGTAKAVDQPTAVFAVRPSKPSVDQPTTMLKAPRPDAPKPDAPEPGAPKPEAPAERTSKFVALKPDIRPEAPKPPVTPDAPKPPAAPDVTTAVPQVGPERTTQQPLPPRPPLDLLAELTNTPPPPDTAVRTAIRRVKIWTPLVILLAIVFAVVQSVRPLPAPTLELTAKDTFTFDGSKIDIPWPADGQAALDVDGIGTFGSSGDQKPVPIASVAKVMTAYLVLRDRPLKSGDKGPNIKIDQLAEDQSNAGQESTVNVTAGDEITQREALESILIASANNVARLLARWDAGSEKSFVAKMNAAAEDLGMTNTTYTDPSGLNDTTVSTAVDQVKLAKAAMKFPAFREVAAMMSYDDYKGTNHSNWNQLVGKNDVVGIKTGTTTSALGNLVFAAKKEVGGETRTIVGAVVRQPAGGPENTILSAALDGGDKLIRAAQGALESATILKKGDVVGYVDDGLGGRTAVVATKDVKAVGWSGLQVKLTFAPDEVPHTAKAGTQVGTLTVGDGSSGAVKIPVALRTELTEPGFTDKLTRIA